MGKVQSVAPTQGMPPPLPPNNLPTAHSGLHSLPGFRQPSALPTSWEVIWQCVLTLFVPYRRACPTIERKTASHLGSPLLSFGCECLERVATLPQSDQRYQQYMTWWSRCHVSISVFKDCVFLCTYSCSAAQPPSG